MVFDCRNLGGFLYKPRQLGIRGLSTFLAKIDVARALDLIDDAIYKDLRALNDIRNAFAHALRVRHASNRVVIVAPMEFGFDPLLGRSEPRSCFFMPVSAPRSTMPSRCSMPPQPDQLRCRHDRHDNGERATPLAVPATQRNQAKILQ